LTYIGAQYDPKILFALGYGGNGITFSMIASQILANKIRNIRDDRETVFGFGRHGKNK